MLLLILRCMLKTNERDHKVYPGQLLKVSSDLAAGPPLSEMCL